VAATACLGQQTFNRGDAGIGSLDRLHRFTHAVLVAGQVGGAAVEGLCGEEVEGVVKSGVDLLACGQSLLCSVQKVDCSLESDEVGPHACGQGYVVDRHEWISFF